MFDLGGLIGGALGAIGEIWSTNEANSAQADLQRQAYEYQKESMQNRHQWEVDDLKAAGLNPILSATNSAGGTISVGAGQAAKADIGKAISGIMNAFTNSAVGKSTIDSNTKNSNANMINAEANKLKAKADWNRSLEDVTRIKNEAAWFLKQTEMADKNYELQRIYTEANVSKVQQDIINSIALVKAEIAYKEKTGDAAVISASASATSAAAAMKNAESQAIVAEVCKQTGASQIEVNKALEGKASAETKEAIERTGQVIDKRRAFQYKHPYVFGNYAPDAPDQYIYQFGDLLKGLSPIID